MMIQTVYCKADCTKSIMYVILRKAVSVLVDKKY